MNFRMQTIRVIVSIASLFLCALFWLAFNNYKQTKIARLSCSDASPISILQPRHAQGNTRVVLLGDSRIRDWGAPDFGENVEVINLGINGATSGELLCKLTDIPPEISADWFILQIGINDLVAASMMPNDMRVKAQEALFRNLQAIVRKLSSAGGRVVVLTLVPPISADAIRQLLWGDDIDEVAAKISQEIMTGLPEDITAYDMRKIFLDHARATWKEDYSSDALHWNRMAYRILTKELKELIAHQKVVKRGGNVTQ